MAQLPKYRKNSPTCNAPCVDFVVRLDGGSGTPVILADGGDRDNVVDYDRGTSGVTDNGSGDHSIHLRENFHDVAILSSHISGTAQSITSVLYDSTNKDIDIVLSADTALTVTVHARGYLNAENY